MQFIKNHKVLADRLTTVEFDEVGINKEEEDTFKKKAVLVKKGIFLI